MKNVRLSIPERLHVFLEKIMNPLAPERGLTKDAGQTRKRMNILLSEAACNTLSNIAKKYKTNKNEISIWIIEDLKDRIEEEKGLAQENVAQLRRISEQVIECTNDTKVFKHKVKLTKATLAAAIITMQQIPIGQVGYDIYFDHRKNKKK